MLRERRRLSSSQPEAEIGCYVRRVTDFLQCQNIRPEGVHIAVVALLKELSQSQARVEQKILAILLGAVAVDFRIVVVAEHIARHGLDLEVRLTINLRHPLGHLHKAVLFHVLVHELNAPARTGHGEEWKILVVKKGPGKVLHHHGKARIVMPLLLGDHES